MIDINNFGDCVGQLAAELQLRLKPREAYERLALDFCTAWELAAADGQADALGGDQYDRVAAEWVAAGCTSAARVFIRAAANRKPA